MKIIANSLLNLKKEYKYSDFTFIILKEYLERKTKKKLIVVSQHEQYLYNPLDKFDKNRIVPTTSEGNKLSKEIIREDIQKIIQEAIIK